MSSDTSLPPKAPVANGSLTPDPRHGEADVSASASTSNPTIPVPPASTRKEQEPTLAEVCADFHLRVQAFLSSPTKDGVTRNTQTQTRASLAIVEKALKDYEFQHLALSYNGGKDCLVLLILYLAVLHTHFDRDRSKSQFEDPSSYPNYRVPFPTSIPSVYAAPPDPFPAVSDFVDSSSRRYHLDLVHIRTGKSIHPHQIPSRSNSTSDQPSQQIIKDLKNDLSYATTSNDTCSCHQRTYTFPEAFGHYISYHHHPDQPSNSDQHNTIPTATTATTNPKPTSSSHSQSPPCKAIFVGTRRTDPHGSSLQPFQLTDSNWPRFMRVHPVLDWRLAEIWSFLRNDRIRYPATDDNSSTLPNDMLVPSMKSSSILRSSGMLEYCSMYDEGYTSLGGVGDTLRNPKLRYWDPETGTESYRPAYELTDDGEERLGRE